MGKKIGIIGLCIFCSILGGCFHIPDKDRLLSNPSKESEKNNTKEFEDFYNSIQTAKELYKQTNSENIENEDNSTKNSINTEENLTTMETNIKTQENTDNLNNEKNKDISDNNTI